MESDSSEYLPVECHPWEPFIPTGAKILIMGTFPPGNHRWSMDFYYPNRTNDFWFVMGHIFLGDRYALYDRQAKKFDPDAIKRLMAEKHIALSDTARKESSRCYSFHHGYVGSENGRYGDCPRLSGDMAYAFHITRLSSGA